MIAIPSCNMLFWFSIQNYYAGVLPEKLEISGPILTAVSGGFWDCHFAVYRLSDKTLNSINREGLAFFSDATIGRGYRKENRNNDNYIYKPWKQKVSEEEITTSGAGREGYACARSVGFDDSMLEKIRLSIRAAGSFYTWGNRRDLRVLQKEGIAVILGKER